MKTKRVLKKIAALSTGVAMLGATMTGALALDTSLADYPAPFITDGVFSGVMTVGKNAAASDTIGQSILLADLQTKAVTQYKKGVSVVGGKTEEISLGDSLNSEFGETLTDSDKISSLQDTVINFDSGDYDVSDVIVLGDGITIETSLTANEDEYLSDVYLEVAKDSIKYFYSFDESILLNKTDNEIQFKAKFLGKTLRLIDIKSDTKFSAYVGQEYFMNSGDSVVVSEKTVKLVRVGSAGAVVVDVDGVQETIPSRNTETVNGIEITNDEVFYDANNQASSAATLIVGDESLETYGDGDAYVGEDDNDPDWVWNVANLNSLTATNIEVEDGDIIENGVILGIENDFMWNDKGDNPITVGGCIDLPEDFVSICVDSLNDGDYATYEIQFEDHADLSDAGASEDEKTIHIKTTEDQGLVTVNNKKTKEIWISGIDANNVGIYYKDDSDGKVKLVDIEVTNDTLTEIGNINFGNTEDSDISLFIDYSPELNGNTELTFKSTLENDDIVTSWDMDGNNIASLGSTLDEEEASELTWDGYSKGNKDEDHRTRYGIIIRDPKTHGANDEVVLDIPDDQVKANVVIKGQTSTTQSADVGGAVIINPIPSSAVALAEEISDAKAQNVIVVGGPAVNPLATEIFDVSVADFTPNEAIIRLADNGAYVALLVAGYGAVDTRNAAEAIVAGKLGELKKAEARVTSATQTVGSYVVE